MRFRPGRLLIVALAALTLLSIAGFYLPALDWLVAVALILIAAMAVIDATRLRDGMRNVTARRILPSPVGRGQPVEVALSVENAGEREWTADIRDEVPATAQPKFWSTAVNLPARGTAQAVGRFVLPIRGRFTFGPLWLRLSSPWALVDAQQSLGELAPIEVFPESLVSAEELAKDAADEIRLLDELRQTRQHGPGTEFESLEEFRHGDDPRHIDWRATARMRRPVIRRFQVERHRDIMLLVDCGRLMGADAERGTKLDCAVDSALRLIRIALRGGDRCGVGIFDSEVRGYMRPIGGAGALPNFLAALYDLQPQWRETDFGPMFARLQARLTKRALVIVISDVSDAETSLRYRASLATLARRHVVLFAALRTPLLRTLVGTRLATVEQGFQKAVTFRLLREREQAIHALRRSGVHVLDVEPAQLTAPLVNQFIQLRQSSLL